MTIDVKCFSHWAAYDVIMDLGNYELHVVINAAFQLAV